MLNDNEYWELLEEQHNHDVVMLPTQIEIEDADDCEACKISGEDD